MSLHTPPPSPQAAEFNVSNVSSASSGSQSSYDSDEDSMYSSGSSSSDESECCESPETSPTSMDVDPPCQPLEDNSKSQYFAPTQQRRHLVDVTNQTPLQYYSLPQNCSAYQKFVAQCYQQYERSYPYDRYGDAHSVYYPEGSGFYAQHAPTY
jgi:hypothetical protein